VPFLLSAAEESAILIHEMSTRRSDGLTAVLQLFYLLLTPSLRPRARLLVMFERVMSNPQAKEQQE